MAITDVFTAAPRPQRIASGILGLVVVAAIGYFVVSPTAAERDVLRQRNETLVAELVKARADEAMLRRFRAQADALRKRLESAEARLPSEREIPGLYRQLSDLALQSGLAVALFASKPAEDRDSVSEIPIAVTAEGTYHQLAGFLSRMGKIPRIVNLGDFRLAGVDRATGTLRAELTLATYLLKPDGAPPAATRPATAPAPAGPGGRPPGATRRTRNREGPAGWGAGSSRSGSCRPSPQPAAEAAGRPVNRCPPPRPRRQRPRLRGPPRPPSCPRNRMPARPCHRSRTRRRAGGTRSSR
jgi:type IV pilus assembly protein PilO